MVDSPLRKRPDNVYSRRPRTAEASLLGNPSVGADTINDDNFATKVLEVLRPVSSSSSSKATSNASGVASPTPLTSGSGEEDSDAEEAKRHCVKNVHELLESGLSNRLYDELDYLVSGLESLRAPPQSAKKASTALYGYMGDLGSKLFEEFSPMQASRLRSSGLLERMFAALAPFYDDSHVVRFIVTCLAVLCSDVRRLDHFISIEVGFRLALALIMSGNTERPGDVQAAKLEKIFQKPKIPTDSMSDLGLWLVAKLVLAISTSSTEEAQSLPTINEHIAVIAAEMGRLLADATISPIRASRIFYILDLVSDQVLLHQLASSILLFVAFATREGPNEGLIEPTVAAIRLLIRISGPSSGAATFSADPEAVFTIKQILKGLARRRRVELAELHCLFCSFCVNIVDRSQACRLAFAEDGDVIELLVSNSREASGSPDTSRYYAMLLGVVVSDLEEERRRLLHGDPALGDVLRAAFASLIDSLSASKCPELLEQLGKFQLVYTSANGCEAAI